MSRINTNVPALIARNNLAKTNQDLATRLRRLSTGLRINTGASDPAGLIVSQRLGSEISSINQSVQNAQRAQNVISTAEGGLQEVSSMLTSMKSLIVEAANTGGFSPAEIKANQLQVDSAIQSINRIANTTSFAGLKLLNGSMDYITSGTTTSQISDVHILGANFGTNSQIPVSVDVLNSAQTASLFISGDVAGSAGKLLSSVSFQVAGETGVQSFSFASGTALSAVAAAVNQVSDATGVKAQMVSATNPTSGLVLKSTDYGSNAFVSVKKLDNNQSFTTYDKHGGTKATRETGADVLALVNGNLALGNGLNVSLHSATLNADLTLTSGAAQTTGKDYKFTITGGGATYQIGPDVNTLQQVGFGMQSVTATALGNSTVGYLNSIISGGANSLVSGNAAQADKIVQAAIDQVSELRGRLGAFEKNTLQTTMQSSQIAVENLTSSQSNIQDANFALETSKMTRDQILQQAGTQTLKIANNSSQNVLQLLQ